MVITNGNLELYAAKYYVNANCAEMEEFYEDYSRLKYVKRLIKKYDESGVLKERLILNHLVVLYNVFDNKACTRMLFFKLENYLTYLVPFLILLKRLPSKVRDPQGDVIYTSDIPLDPFIIERLREI